MGAAVFYHFEDVGYTMLEVLEPTSQCPIYIGNDLTHWLRVKPPGFLSDRFPEFIPAFLARPPIAPLEVVSQEVEPGFPAGIDNSRFARVQR